MKVVRDLHNMRVRYFEDEETKVQYRRIVAGLSPPAVKPGFVVVIGEDLEKDAELGDHHLRVLAEGEDSNFQELLRKCSDFKSRYNFQNLLGDAEDKGMVELVRQFNRNPGSGNSSLHLQNAPDVEDPKCFKYLVLSIQKRLPNDRSLHTLHFDDTSKLRGYLLNEFKREEILTATISDYPAISSLGFAVAYLNKFELLPPLPPLPPQHNLAKSYAIKLDPYQQYRGGRR